MQMKQKTISVSYQDAKVPLDPEVFLHAALAGLAARSGHVAMQRQDCEGVSVPNLAWDHPANLGLFALQKELRAGGVDAKHCSAAVLRFNAMFTGVVEAPELNDYVRREASGRITALTEFLLRAVAVAPLDFGPGKEPQFAAAELARHAARFRALKQGTSPQG